METSNDIFEGDDVDPAAEFLAREKNQLAELQSEVEIEIPPLSINSYVETVELDDTDENDMRHSEFGLQDFGTHLYTREEPEKIKKWREEQKTRLQEKDSEEEKKRGELQDQARKELLDWYKQHEDTIAKTKSSNRNAEKQFVADIDEIEPGTEWERIAKLCDFNPKSNKSNSDVSRMRSIILQLKQTPISTNR